MNWILASGSPRRRELLEMLGVPDLTIRPAAGPERATPGAGPGAYPLYYITEARRVSSKILKNFLKNFLFWGCISYKKEYNISIRKRRTKRKVRN